MLRLNNWPDNGCPILYFVVQYRAISDEGEDPWTLVSNALKPQRRFQITSLRPSTLYQLKMEAHNVAGATNADFTFVTLTKEGGKGESSWGCLTFNLNLALSQTDPPPPDIEHRRNRAKFFYNDAKIIITAIITVTLVICSGALMIICLKMRK